MSGCCDYKRFVVSMKLLKILECKMYGRVCAVGFLNNLNYIFLCSLSNTFLLRYFHGLVSSGQLTKDLIGLEIRWCFIFAAFSQVILF